MMAEIREAIQGTIAAFVENNMTAVKRKDTALFSACLSENCVKMYRPLSLIKKYPQFFKAQVTNAEFEAQMQMELPRMKEVVQKVTRTVIDVHQRVANIWVENTVHTADGSTTSVEVIFDLEFTEDGKQISRYIEFVDTHESIKVLEQVLSMSGAS